MVPDKVVVIVLDINSNTSIVILISSPHIKSYNTREWIPVEL